MTAFHRLALGSLLSLAALAAWPQQPLDGAVEAQPLPPGMALPGTVVERNVFVPVDSTGHTGGEYIVIERRVMKKDDAGKKAPGEVPTHFILVPQDGDDDEDADSNEGGADSQ